MSNYLNFIGIISAIQNNHWQPSIGDPTLMGWLTVFAYLLAAFLCFLCAIQNRKLRIKQRLSNYDYFLWWFLALTLFFLALNKQLDLQSLFTVVGKEIAQAQGWYRNRRSVQTLFIASISAIAVSFITLMIAKVKFNRSSNFWGMVGIVVIFSFVIIRAASFHHVDRLIGLDLLGFKLNWLFELTGITIICYSALLRLAGKG